MSRLGDLENTIVSRVAAATISGSPAFATVKGVSGGNRPALRDAIRRERMPAALVAFIDEPTSPETRPDRLGANFAVFVAAQALRAGSNPRHGDSSAAGAFTLMDKVRAQLDGYMPSGEIELQSLSQKFVDADDRVVMYELNYRAWPAYYSALTFEDEPIAGSDSRLILDIGSVVPAEKGATNPPARPIVWRGRIRAEDQESLTDIEEGIEDLIQDGQAGRIGDNGERTISGCVPIQYLRIGPRQVDPIDGAIFQRAEIVFMQQFGE